jgi:hypothetical protein
VKITAKDAEGVLDDIVLGDDGGGDWIIDPPPLPVERRKVQITPLFRGATPFAWGRGNRAVSFSWTVARDHASADAAGAFMRGHPTKVPINVTLTVDDGAGTDSYTGVIVEVAPVDRFGRATVFRYGIDGAVLAQPLDTDPSAPAPSPS